MSKKNYAEHNEEVKAEETPKNKTGVVTAEKLNLRQAASADAKVLYVLSKGDVLEIIEDRIDWLKVRYTKLAIDGYVMSKFVKVE